MYVYMCQGSVISLVLSHLNKNLKQRTLKPPACHSSQTDRVIALRQISVTALFYSSVLFRKQQENTSSRREGVLAQRREEKGERKRESVFVGKRERPGPLARLLIGSPPPGPALCKLCQPVVLFVLPEVLTPVLKPSFDLPFFYFCGLFPSLPFSHCHFGLLFPILTT